MKRPISVTLSPENLIWLRSRAATHEYRSVSDALDSIVAEAREAYGARPAGSVVGTISIDPRDPGLDTADEAVRALFERGIVVAQEPRVAGSRKPVGRRGSRARA